MQYKRQKNCMFYKIQQACEVQTAECIHTPTGLDSHGYGQCRDRQKMRKAHQIAYEHIHKKIPTGMLVLHSCDNRTCINPRHLSLGTNDDNMADMVKRGRAPREKQHTAILTWAKVADIRTSSKTPEELSEMYGVRKQQIKRILKGDAWAYES